MRIYTPIASLAERAAEAGLRDVVEHVLAASNERTPKDDGDLISSGRTGVDGLQANVAYRSFYAMWIHERVDWRHDGGGEAKFLENAAEAEKDEAVRIMARAARRETGG